MVFGNTFRHSFYYYYVLETSAYNLSFGKLFMQYRPKHKLSYKEYSMAVG